MRKKLIILISFLTVLTVGLSFALLNFTSAQVIEEVSFQGKIVNKSDGTNLNAGAPSCIVAGADTCDFRVSIYDVTTGGTAFWTEIHQDIELGDYNGIFNFDIGGICNTTLGGSWDSDPGADPNNLCTTSGGGFNWEDYTNLYFEIEFDDDGNGDFVTPEVFARKKFTATPYAFRSQTSASSEDVTNLSDVIQFNDVNTATAIDFSDATYNSLPGGYNSLLHALNAASGGGGGLWTINGNVTYLTSSGSDLSLSSTLVSAFSVDESENLTRLGSGSGTNARLDFYSSTGDTGRLEYTLDLLQFSGGDFRLTDNIELILGSDNDIKLLYDETGDDRLEIVDSADSLIASFDYIGTDAEVVIDGNLTLGTPSSTGQLKLSDGSSSVISIIAPTIGADYTLTLPTTDGNANEFLQTDGNGALTWTTSTFNLLGDSGTQAINAGDDLTIIGGTAITTTAGDTDQLTIDFDPTAALDITGDWEFQDSEQLLFGNDADIRFSFDGTDTLNVTDGTNTLFSIIDAGTTGRVRIGSNTNDVISIGTTGTGATADLYFGDDLLCDVSETNCGWVAGTGLFTDSGTLTYLTQTSDDFAIGASTLAAPFSVDVATQTVRIGDGTTSNGILQMYAINGESGRIIYGPDDTFVVTGAGVSIVDDLELSFGTNYEFNIDYDEAGDDRLEFTDASNNLLAALTDNANEGDLLLTGDLLAEGGVATLGNATTAGSITLFDGTSNTISLVTPSIGANYTLTLPTTDGNASEFLQTNGSGVLTWATSAFDVIGDTGTQTINAGDDLTFIGGTAINTTAGATDELTIDFDPTANLDITGDWEFQDTEQLLFGTDGDTRVSFDGTDTLNVTDGTNTLFSIIDVGTTGRIRIGSSANDILSIGTVGTGADGDLYFGDDLLCDVSESNCGWAAGQGGLFTDGGAITYLTQETDDLAIGAQTLVAPFSVDVDSNIVRIGDGVNDTNDARLMFYASDATNDGTIAFRDTDLFELDGADLLFQDNRTAFFGTDSDIQITYDETTDDRLEFSNGTNLLAALTDNSGQGDLLLSGDIDIDGNLFSLGTAGTGDATISLFANDGDTGVLTYTTNDRIELTGGGFLIADDLAFTFGTDSDFNIAYDETTDDRLEITDSASNLLATITDQGTTGGIMVTDDFYVNAIGLNDSGVDNITSAASILGVYDEFVNSTGTNIQDVLKDLDDAIAGGGSLFLSAGGVTYRSDSADDFSVGAGATIVSPFSVDVDTNTVRIGDGVSDANDPTLAFFASDATNSGEIVFTDDDRFTFNNADVLLNDDLSLFFGTDADAFLIYDETTDDRLELGFGANTFLFIDDVASETYGAFEFTGTTTLGTGLAGAETALYINPAAGFTGSLLDIDVDGSDIFEVSTTGVRSDVPATFSNAGDVQIAYDLQFTNSTAANILSDSPLYITAGDLVSDEDLILSANNDGYVIVDDRLDVEDIIRLGGNANNYLGTSVGSNPATDDLFWGDQLLCDASETNCGFGSEFTDGGTITYLTDTAEDFAIGGSSLSAALSIDVSENLLQVGTGSTANGRIDLFSTNGNSVRFEATDSDVLELNNGGFIFNQAGDAVDFVIEGDTDPDLFFADGSADFIGIGTNSPSDKLDVRGDIRVGTGSTGCVKDADGTVIAGTCSSDFRLKKNISPVGSILDRYSRLEPVTYNWRADEFPERGLGTKKVTGLIAQDVEELFPELISVDNDGFKQIDFTTLSFYSIQAIKDQTESISGLSSSLEIIEGKINSIETSLNEIENLKNRIDSLESQIASMNANQGGTQTLSEAIIQGKLTVQGKVYLSSDSVGSGTIYVGGTETTINFSGSYENIPKINITPNGDSYLISPIDYVVTNKTVAGFTVRILAPQSYDFTFDWIAFGTN